MAKNNKNELTKNVKNTKNVKSVQNAKGQEDKEYFSVREVAEMSGFSYGTVKRAIEMGSLAAYRIGRRFFIDKATAAEFCQEHKNRRSAEGYTLRELMGKLSLSYAYLTELVKSGELKSSRVGRQYIVSEEDFRDFMEKNRLKR
jgi:excisionase family DNA binding protein